MYGSAPGNWTLVKSCQRERDPDDEREEVPGEDLSAGDRDVAPPVVVRLQQRIQSRFGRRHHEFGHVAELDEQVPGQHQRNVRRDSERVALQCLVHKPP